MWRVLLAGMVLSGCSGGTQVPDGGTETAHFVPQYCTSGMPGDPTCPVNHVDVSTPTIALHASFVARRGSMLEISGFILDGAATQVGGVYMDVWCADCYQPLASKLVAASLAIGETAPTFTISQFTSSETMTLRIDAIR